MSYLRKNFCDVCVKFNRSKTLVRTGSIDEFYMLMAGMCQQCFLEANPHLTTLAADLESNSKKDLNITKESLQVDSK